MSDTLPFLLERLRAEGEKTAAFFGSVADPHWSLPVYTDGETWTVRSLLAHFVSSEHEMRRLIEDVAAGGPGAAPDFDLDDFNARQLQQLAGLSPAELIERYRAARLATVDYVATLKEAELEKQGRHPALGMLSLGDMIKVVYRHNRLHERDLRPLLAPGE